MNRGRQRWLDRARVAYGQRAWRDAFDAFSRAGSETPLDVEDLESLAWSAALCGRDTEVLSALERLYRLHADAQRHEQAARAAFWSGFRLFALGETGRATAWMQRAQRALEREGDLDCCVRGYLLLPVALRHLVAGDSELAHDAARSAAEIGERFSDADLVAFARGLQGRALMRSGKIDEALALLDEAMLPATNDELTPIVTGLVYCSVIAACCQIYAMDRAREWTAALAHWCEAQPQLVPFSGTCRVHRAELMQLSGAWPEAVAEAEEAFRHLGAAADRNGAGAACYQCGEIHRLRGELVAAEECYREASRLGREPQPGLSLLRLAQGRADEAAVAIRRVLGTATDPLRRAQLLPAFVEILLAGGEAAASTIGVRGDDDGSGTDAARSEPFDAVEETAAAAEELGAIARKFATEVLQAMAAHARGAVQLARGDSHAALAQLRTSFSIWQKVGAPYIAARLRVLMARACLELGDKDGAELELDAAQPIFEGLSAAPDLAALALLRPDVQNRRPPEAPTKAGQQDGAAAQAVQRGEQVPALHPLTPRELEVLRFLAEGMTNRAIAEALGLSGKTVDRHVENIFNKLGVSSRAAATACAYRRGLL
jgi:DNA-binding CsgD family transcriptional regulator